MTEIISIADLVQDELNANRGSERGQLAVNNSIMQSGAGRSILVDRNGNIIAGNKTTKAAVLAGLDVQIVRSDGTKLIAVMREDLDINSPEARLLAVADNRTSELGLEWDADILADMVADGMDFGDLFEDWELEDLGVNLEPADDFGDGDAEEKDIPALDSIPDTIWASDNEWGIPTLDITKQANSFDLPIETWGAKARGTMAGTIHFYTDDYRFNNLWARPDKLLQSGAINIVEPNFSVYDQAPAVIALWATYRKRWLARYWQSRGVKVFVDLNVARQYDNINMLGVPRGWKSYATRGYSSRVDMIAQELNIAQVHADSDSILFLVYGGGLDVKEWCMDNNAVWVAEDMDRAKGKYLDTVI